MKKISSIAVIFLAVACVPDLRDNNRTETGNVASVISPITLSEVTHQKPTNPHFTATPSLYRVPPDLIERKYTTSEWNLIYDKGIIWESEIDPAGVVWIHNGPYNIGYRSNEDWILFGENDFLLYEGVTDMALSEDGAVWLVDESGLAKYINGRWKKILFPEGVRAWAPQIAVDHRGQVWVSLFGCDCADNLKRYDGAKWIDEHITENNYEAMELLFSSNGHLWAALANIPAIGRYDGIDWKIIDADELQITAIKPFENMTLATDKHNHVFLYTQNGDVIIINDDEGEIMKIPFPIKALAPNPMQVYNYIDSRGVLWVYATIRQWTGTNTYNEIRGTNIAYYYEGAWHAFTGLPFNIVKDFSEFPDGTMAISTERGLYQLLKPI